MGPGVTTATTMSGEPLPERGWAPIARSADGVPEVAPEWVARHGFELRLIDLRGHEEQTGSLGRCTLLSAKNGAPQSRLRVQRSGRSRPACSVLVAEAHVLERGDRADRVRYASRHQRAESLVPDLAQLGPARPLVLDDPAMPFFNIARGDMGVPTVLLARTDAEAAGPWPQHGDVAMVNAAAAELHGDDCHVSARLPRSSSCRWQIRAIHSINYGRPISSRTTSNSGKTSR